jgi:hypothetical protein
MAGEMRAIESRRSENKRASLLSAVSSLLVAVVGLSAIVPLVIALWRVVLWDFFRRELPLPALGFDLAFVVIAVGLLLAVVCLLLRLRVYRDGSGPPSLTSAILVIALGVGLGVTATIAGRGATYPAQTGR